jgi:hypothetical protein
LLGEGQSVELTGVDNFMEPMFVVVSINGGTPNGWFNMVYNGTSQSKMDDFGVPLFWETSMYIHY